MLSAQQQVGARTNDIATAEYEFRMDFASQLASRRTELGFSPAQLAESAQIPERDLILVEQGVAFAGSHEVAVDALVAITRLEELRDGKSHLRSV